MTNVDPFWKQSLWSQFGAAIDMLENAIRACPEELWWDRSQHIQFGCTVAHALFWLDFYLSGIIIKDFAPPAPFTIEGLNRTGTLTEPVYGKAEMQSYLQHGRNKCRETLRNLTDEQAHTTWGFDDWTEKLNFVELLLYNMRHVQEHNAQLAFVLGQTHNLPPNYWDWVGAADDRL